MCFALDRWGEIETALRQRREDRSADPRERETRRSLEGAAVAKARAETGRVVGESTRVRETREICLTH